VELRELLKLPRLVECKIIRRTGLFSVEVELNGELKRVYLNNTGRLINVIKSGLKGYLVENKSPGKYEYRLVGVEWCEWAALVDTSIQEKEFLEAQSRGFIPWLFNCTLNKRNYRVDGEVIDYAFTCGGMPTLVELKSAVMELPGGYAGYPDAPTPRGRRQITALAKYAKSGGRAIVVFVAGLPRVRGFKLYCGADREIGGAVKEAANSGVLFKSIEIYLNPRSGGIVLGAVDLPVDISCSDY
jgi:sugar fermentation stimulation protein A